MARLPLFLRRIWRPLLLLAQLPLSRLHLLPVTNSPTSVPSTLLDPPLVVVSCHDLVLKLGPTSRFAIFARKKAILIRSALRSVRSLTLFTLKGSHHLSRVFTKELTVFEPLPIYTPLLLPPPVAHLVPFLAHKPGPPVLEFLSGPLPLLPIMVTSGASLKPLASIWQKLLPLYLELLVSSL